MVSLSGQHLNLVDIAAHHADAESALRLYYSRWQLSGDRFDGYTKNELFDELERRLKEQKILASLSILTALEAAFRIDYFFRVHLKLKDALSREFRILNKNLVTMKRKHYQIALEKDIIGAWAKHSTVSKTLIEDLKGAFRYRHWLAHGRYWNPKMGRRYDYDGIYILAQNIFDSFPLLTSRE